MKKKAYFLIVSVFLGMYLNSAWAYPVEKQVKYSKKTDLVATWPVNWTFRFSLWDSDIGGSEVWSENKQITMQSNVINTNLGNTESLDGVNFSQQLWVQVEKYNSKKVYGLK
jgi:hypothetical protein